MRAHVLAALALVLAALPAHADERTATVVVRVGPRAVTVGEIEDRLAQLSPLQRASYGATPEAIRKKFVDEVIVPEALLELGAEQKKLVSRPEVSYDLDRTRADATLRAVRAKVGPASSIPEADARKYYDENKARYDAPERINIWRIPCKTREEADTVLAAAKKDSAVTSWNALARDHSVEKSSALRGGNLGFVGPDGASNESGVKVDPAVVKAAAAVKDGELVATPIEEPGMGWSVVWRRGTVGASKRSFDEVAPQIRDTLFKQRVEVEMKKLTADLRAANVKGFAPEILETVDLTPAATVVPRKRPGQVPPLGAPSSSSSAGR